MAIQGLASPVVDGGGARDRSCGAANRRRHQPAGEDQVTLNTVALVTVPAAVLTVIAHDLAPGGTLTTTDVADTVLIGAAVDPNNTLVVVPSACPLMVTVVPTGPAGGVKFLIMGVADVVTRPMELVN